MWQLSESIDGMAEACRVLNVPVVGGNVSLYNATDGVDIDPTPIVGVLGLVDSLVKRPPGIGLVEGCEIVLIGSTLSAPLGGSRFAWDRLGHRGGELPALDLVDHADLVETVRRLVADEAVVGIHDVSEGGLLVALAEMAVMSEVGFRVTGLADAAALFHEAPSRVVACVASDRAGEVGGTRIGRAGSDRLIVDGLIDIPIDVAIDAWRMAQPRASLREA